MKISFVMSKNIFIATLALLMSANFISAKDGHRAETIALRVVIGSASSQIGFDSTVDGEPLFTSSFAVASNGSIWIDDPVHRSIKKFNADGHYSMAIRTDSLIVDDIVVLSNGDLAVSCWNSNKISVFDDQGRFLYECVLPHAPKDITNLYSCGEKLFVDFEQRQEDPRHPHRIGLEFSSTGTLLHTRSDSAAVWAASCGRLHGNVIDSWYNISLDQLIDSNGRFWAPRELQSNLDLNEIGSDCEGDIYFTREAQNGTNTDLRVYGFSATGSERCSFPVHDTDSNSSHWIKVDCHGNVYVLVSPWESHEIVIFKYPSS